MALFDGAACAEQVAQDLFKVRRRIFLLRSSVPRAFTVKQKILGGSLRVQKKEGYKHRVVQATVGKKTVLVLEMQYENDNLWARSVLWPQVGQRESNRKADNNHRWKDGFMGGHHLQRIVDWDKVRTLIWCRTCAGWTTTNKLGKHQKSSMSTTRSEGRLLAKEAGTRDAME